ncbi:hypothetical protein BU23DRAFT_553230 [Bimuria novae-zelandiae CBS 107.79]|uniref:Uncharacterized protein n=1 Tax=Bimuria novae-zelandiae CBS 107.79 TaxID=1447943 RepID=A0A6A5VAU7_9PLEO|nr:hypothetical protein BU23DRAFT_553230 [Bimuria novae-zelandiae CBS 107.79]
MSKISDIPKLDKRTFEFLYEKLKDAWYAYNDKNTEELRTFTNEKSDLWKVVQDEDRVERLLKEGSENSAHLVELSRRLWQKYFKWEKEPDPHQEKFRLDILCGVYGHQLALQAVVWPPNYAEIWRPKPEWNEMYKDVKDAWCCLNYLDLENEDGERIEGEQKLLKAFTYPSALQSYSIDKSKDCIASL